MFGDKSDKRKENFKVLIRDRKRDPHNYMNLILCAYAHYNKFIVHEKLGKKRFAIINMYNKIIITYISPSHMRENVFYATLIFLKKMYLLNSCATNFTFDILCQPDFSKVSILSTIFRN